MAKTKVALVGFSDRSRDLAPYDDPEWEIWGCNHVYRFIPRVDVNFEIHRLKEVEAKLGPVKWPAYAEWLRTTEATVYMQDTSPEFPAVKRLPIEELDEMFSYEMEHIDYVGTGPGDRHATKRERYPWSQFKSTLSYMMCMALREKRFEEIAVYGVEMRDDSEWHFQRMNFSFFLGWARGAGVKLVIPEMSALLQEAGIRRYGYEESRAEKYKPVIDNRGQRVRELDARLARMDEENEAMVRRIHEIRGAMNVLDEMAVSANGDGEEIRQKREDMQRDLAAVMETQRMHLHSMMSFKGRRDESFELMEYLGYHNRGEMPEGRA